MLQFLSISLALMAVFYYVCIKPFFYWINRDVKQTKYNWIVGDTWRIIFKMESYSQMVIRIYNEIPNVRFIGMYFSTKPCLLIKDPDLIKELYVKYFDHFTDRKPFVPGDADLLWSRGLIALKGEKWRDMRSFLSPSFTSSKMKNMFVLMAECADNLTNHFLKKNQDIIEVDVQNIFTRFSCDVIATTACGINSDSLEDPDNEFYNMGTGASNSNTWKRRIKHFLLIFFPKFYEFLKIKVYEEDTSNYYTGIIGSNIEKRKKEGIIRPDMIHLLMEAQKELKYREESKTGYKELTIMDITAQAMSFFVAGFDTVASTVAFTAYELAINPDIQKRLRNEILETLLECKGNITYDVLLKMKYFDMVISEVLRKWPVGVAVDRTCTKPFTIQPVTPEEKPLRIEKGEDILLPIIGLHYDPKIYPNPQRFDPERFNDENKANIDPYTYVPFGVGPRTCIGLRFAILEIKIVIFKLLSKFEIVPTEKTVIPASMSKKHVLLRIEGGYDLALKRVSN